MNKIEVLWKHYSSWFLGAIVALGALHEFGLEIEGLPRWVTPVLAVCALVAKLVRQAPAPVGSDPSYGESLDEARK
jgi:hypothetical protein